MCVALLKSVGVQALEGSNPSASAIIEGGVIGSMADSESVGARSIRALRSS